MPQAGELSLTFSETEHGSALYEEAVELRARVLRQPLGLAFTPEQLAAEKTERHFVCLDGQRVVACTTLVPLDATTIKLRQMAVVPSHQGRRIGQGLLAYAEEIARSRGFVQIVLHARESAIGFYGKSGYTVTGAPFVEITIPHRKMIKRL
ncbi:MAG: GNAT family N-acetyltransferase [Alphaproteobacteria bacterium]|nr:GNAT family N-acetyltransferase [Alphaproteobacteria bacterium]